jgi:hypothetical protein
MVTRSCRRRVVFLEPAAHRWLLGSVIGVLVLLLASCGQPSVTTSTSSSDQIGPTTSGQTSSRSSAADATTTSAAGDSTTTTPATTDSTGGGGTSSSVPGSPATHSTTTTGPLTPLITQTISFAPVGAKRYLDPAFRVTATATSQLPVTYTASGACSVAPTTGVVTIKSSGTCTVTASRAADRTWASATRSVAIAVAKAPQKITFADRQVDFGRFEQHRLWATAPNASITYQLVPPRTAATRGSGGMYSHPRCQLRGSVLSFTDRDGDYHSMLPGYCYVWALGTSTSANFENPERKMASIAIYGGRSGLKIEAPATVRAGTQFTVRVSSTNGNPDAISGGIMNCSATSDRDRIDFPRPNETMTFTVTAPTTTPPKACLVWAQASPADYVFKPSSLGESVTIKPA